MYTFLWFRNGEEWYKFRSAILPLLQPSVVKAYANQHMQVASNFVDYIQMKMDESSSEIVTDICQHLMKFSIEGTSLLYDKQFIMYCVLTCFNPLKHEFH
jgi:cytochrome P450